MNYLFGFSYWKHGFIEPFFEENLIFVNPIFGRNPLKKALKKGLNSRDAIYIWGKKSFPDIEKYASLYEIPFYRVEDGFIRSIGLGSDLTQPYSLVVDSCGIYFDPTQESDLENILQNSVFNKNEIIRAQHLQRYLIDKKLSKYNLYENINLLFPTNKLIIIVPGQVEDDASIRYGTDGMTNIELLKQVRINRPDAYIVYKPHPDVLVGNRVGHIEECEALLYCDKIVTEVGIDSVLCYADEVHTMTSLVGFEALIRGKKVVTYGMPFYSGWGLTEDKMLCERRTRLLTIDELVIGTYFMYPRYIHPETLKQCEIEELLLSLEKKRALKPFLFGNKIRNWLSRKLQLVLRML